VRIGYLVALFPKVSETFVLNEVLELERRGMDIVPLSFERSRSLEPKVQGAASGLQQPVRYLLDDLPGPHLTALGWWLVRRPLGVLRMFAANRRHPAPRGETKLGRFVLALRCARVVRRLGITHLHAHWSYPGDVGLLIRRYLVPDVSFSFTAHAHDIFDDIDLYERDGFAFGERIAAARFVVTCTAYNREYLERYCPPDQHGKLYHAYHGLDTERFSPPAGGRVIGEAPQLLSVGRFVRYKGFDVIVGACSVLKERGRPVRAWLVGPEGSQTEPVKQQIRHAGLEDWVQVLGPKTHGELLELYSAADIYVSASDPDGEYGVANVIVEALATGLPTIATHKPQVTEYIEDEVNGLLVHYGESTELADAIERLADDGRLARRLGEAGRKLAEERFDICATADMLAELFAGVGGGPTGRTPPVAEEKVA
jgi:glycosyltransferase involved in cell wall biosynthesis